MVEDLTQEHSNVETMDAGDNPVLASPATQPLIDRNATLEQIRACFANDRFATEQAFCAIDSASYGSATCSMDLSPKHLNAQGHPMGGAIFTLADYALAVACNVGEPATVAISNTIDFFSRAKGKRLIATARTLRSGRHVGFYLVDIHDEIGTYVAQMSAKCYR
jgi:acyl-CoA thioesterase